MRARRAIDLECAGLTALCSSLEKRRRAAALQNRLSPVVFTFYSTVGRLKGHRTQDRDFRPENVLFTPIVADISAKKVLSTGIVADFTGKKVLSTGIVADSTAKKVLSTRIVAGFTAKKVLSTRIVADSTAKKVLSTGIAGDFTGKKIVSTRAGLECDDLKDCLSARGSSDYGDLGGWWKRRFSVPVGGLKRDCIEARARRPTLEYLRCK